jgi:hypothetical protein
MRSCDCFYSCTIRLRSRAELSEAIDLSGHDLRGRFLTRGYGKRRVVGDLVGFPK